jgi:CRP-like cAMP-binding protein
MNEGPFAVFVRHAEDYDTYPDGAVIFKSGDEGDCLYAVRSGQVELKDGDVLLDVVEPGSVFGEMVLVGRTHRSATAIARGETTLVAVDQARFDRLVSINPFIAREFMRLMADRISAMNQRIQASTQA